MPQNYVLLQRIELNASAASVTFSNIPQSGYTDLKIVCSVRGTTNTGAQVMFVQYNNDSTQSNYSRRRLLGDGSSASSTASSDSEAAITQGANATANTFSNMEVYIPNYRGSTNKSASIDFVNETNATTEYMGLYAHIWNNTAAITSVSIIPNGGSFVANSTFSLYGLAAVGTTPAIAPKATGGNITTDGTYFYHTFLATDIFTPFTNLSCDYLVVAGGGGGGGYSGGVSGGGGGAGGLRSTVGATGGGGSLESKLSVIAQAYTITVGAGGAGGSGDGQLNGYNGTNSTFSTITSTGGGGGGRSGNGIAGGSGGGGAHSANGGAASPSGQGYAGGNGYPNTQDSELNTGGGGGAGAAGANATTTTGGNGGNGVTTSISGSSITYAGGGGGGVYNQTVGTGGTGGGGNGGKRFSSVVAPTGGGANTGGGGGGGGQGRPSDGYSWVGNGGSGIVIIRYTIA